MNDLVYSIGTLAARFRLPVDWFRQQVEAGTIPCLRVGRRRIFSLRHVEAALAHLAGGTDVPRVEARPHAHENEERELPALDSDSSARSDRP